MAGQAFPVFSPPSEEQRLALTIAAAYLKLSSTEAATRLLPGVPMLDGQIELMAQLRDDLNQSAVLCEILVEVFDGWPAIRR